MWAEWDSWAGTISSQMVFKAVLQGGSVEHPGCEDSRGMCGRRIQLPSMQGHRIERDLGTERPVSPQGSLQPCELALLSTPLQAAVGPR